MIFNYIVIIATVVYLLLGLFLAASQKMDDNAFKRVIYAWMFIFFWPITTLAKHFHILK